MKLLLWEDEMNIGWITKGAWKQVCKIVFATWFLWFGVVSNAGAAIVTMDFSSGTYSTVAPGVDNWYTEDGFAIHTPPADHFDSGPHGPLTPVGRPYLLFHEGSANPVNNLITLDFSGALFDFNSFDLLRDPTDTRTVNLAMAVRDSTGRAFNTTANFIGTYTLNWSSVRWVTFDIITTSNCCNTYMDNIVLDNGVVNPPAVPEPETYAMLLAGLGLMGFTARRRKAS